MKRVILTASIAGVAVAGLILYFVKRNKKRNQDEFTIDPNSFKYVGGRTHNSLHEII